MPHLCLNATRRYSRMSRPSGASWRAAVSSHAYSGTLPVIGSEETLLYDQRVAGVDQVVLADPAPVRLGAAFGHQEPFALGSALAQAAGQGNGRAHRQAGLPGDAAGARHFALHEEIT